MLTMRNVRQYYVNNEKIGKVCVIVGDVRNEFPQPKALIRVEAAVYDKDKKPLAVKQQLAGSQLSLFQLQVLGEKELESFLQSSTDIYIRNSNVPPGGEVPFMVLFYVPSEKVAEFGVRIAGVEDVAPQPGMTPAQPVPAAPMQAPAPAQMPAPASGRAAGPRSTAGRPLIPACHIERGGEFSSSFLWRSLCPVFSRIPFSHAAHTDGGGGVFSLAGADLCRGDAGMTTGSASNNPRPRAPGKRQEVESRQAILRQCLEEGKGNAGVLQPTRGTLPGMPFRPADGLTPAAPMKWLADDVAMAFAWNDTKPEEAGV